MINLKSVPFSVIQPWFSDYQKKSKNYDPPPNGSEILGIYRGVELIGYFIIVCYTSKVVEVNQGFLKPESRHKNLMKIGVKLLEDKARKAGFKKIMTGTNRAVGSYIRWMRSMNYEICKAVFSKEL